MRPAIIFIPNKKVVFNEVFVLAGSPGHESGFGAIRYNPGSSGRCIQRRFHPVLRRVHAGLEADHEECDGQRTAAAAWQDHRVHLSHRIGCGQGEVHAGRLGSDGHVAQGPSLSGRVRR